MHLPGIIAYSNSDMNTERLDSILEEIKRPLLLELMHAVEDLTAPKPVGRLMTFEEQALLDYLFAGGLYPINEDSDYRELGEIFGEDD